MNRNELAKGYAAVVATALLWSLGGLFIKMIPWAAISINGARCLVAFAFKTVVRRSVKVRFTRASVTAALCMCATTTLFTQATKLTTAGNAIMLQYSMPVFLILATWVYTKRRPARVDVLSCAVIVGGVFLCCLDNMTTGGGFGNLLALLSGVAFSMYFFINSLPGALPDDANYLGFLLSGLIGLPSLLKETVFTLPVILYAVLLGAFQLGLAYVLFEYGIRRISAVSASFISSVEPILNPVWVAVFYHEKIGLLAVAGSVLVVAATAFYSIANARRAAGEPAGEAVAGR